MKKTKLISIGIVLAAGAIACAIVRRRSGCSTKRLPNQSIYRFYAPNYDLFFGRPYESARRRTVNLLELQPGERLLISGVGTGLDLPMIPSGVDVSGIDISPEMLQQAEWKVSQANIHLIPMDAQNLEFPDESFDAALLNLIVSVAPDGRAVFQEAWRTLKPGGRMIIFDKFAPENRPIGLLREALGGLFRLLGTDVNRKLSDVLEDLDAGEIEINEPSVFFGLYRIVKLRKAA